MLKCVSEMLYEKEGQLFCDINNDPYLFDSAADVSVTTDKTALPLGQNVVIQGITGQQQILPLVQVAGLSMARGPENLICNSDLCKMYQERKNIRWLKEIDVPKLIEEKVQESEFSLKNKERLTACLLAANIASHKNDVGELGEQFTCEIVN